VEVFYSDPVQSENLQLHLKSCADLERIIQKVAIFCSYTINHMITDTVNNKSYAKENFHGFLGF